MASAYYNLLNCLSQDHVTYLAALEPRAFVYILESLNKGLAALGTYNFTQQIYTFTINTITITINNYHYHYFF